MASIGAVASIGERGSNGAGGSIGEMASIGARASIGERASIGAWASIGDKVQWLKSPLAVQGTRHLVTNCAPGQINIGCHIFTFEKFQQATLAERAEFQIANGYTPEECAEYIKIVEFVIANGVPAESEATA